MAHTKAQRAAKVNKDSRSKRRGVKIYGGSAVKAGNIIVRQKGSRFKAGAGAYTGKDFTLHAERDGIVTFTNKGEDTIVSVNS